MSPFKSLMHLMGRFASEIKGFFLGLEKNDMIYNMLHLFLKRD